jgi:hypothetical protein
VTAATASAGAAIGALLGASCGSRNEPSPVRGSPTVAVGVTGTWVGGAGRVGVAEAVALGAGRVGVTCGVLVSAGTTVVEGTGDAVTNACGVCGVEVG